MKVFVTMVCLFMLCTCSLGISAGDTGKAPELTVEATTGGAAGWWLYNKGFDAKSPGTHRGHDRSHLTLIVPVDLVLAIELDSWSVGLNAGLSWLYEDRMIGSDETYAVGSRYDLSEKAVRFFKYAMVVSYRLAERRKYMLAPRLTVGSFTVETLHPERENFGFRYFFRFELESAFHLSDRISLLASPYYEEMTIMPKIETFEGMRNKVHGLGINAGLKYRF